MSARAPEAGADVALPGFLGRARLVARRRGERPRDDRAGAWSSAELRARVALAVVLLSSFLIVLVAAGHPTSLVPRSNVAFPGWFSGPLHLVASGVSITGSQLNWGLSLVLVLMSVAYLGLIRYGAVLESRVVIGGIVALHVVWLLAPLMPLTDVFNYLGYARLGALHGFNPYEVGIGVAYHDPVNLMTTWHNLRTPYGPLFTIASYALAPMPLAVGYWVLKVVTVAASLGCVALLWRCASQLGRSPQRAVLFFFANPLVLVYEVGAFHNDVFMLLPILAGITFLLGQGGRGQRQHAARAGAAFVVAFAIKASAAIVLPFGLIATRERTRFLAAAVAAGIGTLLLSTLVFGFAIPNLGDQSTLLSTWSVPNVVGRILLLGGAPPWFLSLAKVAVVVTVLWLCWLVWQDRMNWITASGWATFALILSLSWTLPSYVVWLTPLAALAPSRALRRATLLLSLFFLITVLPAFSLAVNAIHYKPMNTAVGRASTARMVQLQR